MLGLESEFSPLDATGSLVTVDKAVCRTPAGKSKRRRRSASLRAWVPGYSTDYTVTIDELQGSFPSCCSWFAIRLTGARAARLRSIRVRASFHGTA